MCSPQHDSPHDPGDHPDFLSAVTADQNGPTHFTNSFSCILVRTRKTELFKTVMSARPVSVRDCDSQVKGCDCSLSNVIIANHTAQLSDGVVSIKSLDFYHRSSSLGTTALLTSTWAVMKWLFYTRLVVWQLKRPNVEMRTTHDCNHADQQTRLTESCVTSCSTHVSQKSAYDCWICRQESKTLALCCLASVLVSVCSWNINQERALVAHVESKSSVMHWPKYNLGTHRLQFNGN